MIDIVNIHTTVCIQLFCMIIFTTFHPRRISFNCRSYKVTYKIVFLSCIGFVRRLQVSRTAFISVMSSLWHYLRTLKDDKIAHKPSYCNYKTVFSRNVNFNSLELCKVPFNFPFFTPAQFAFSVDRASHSHSDITVTI